MEIFNFNWFGNNFPIFKKGQIITLKDTKGETKNFKLLSTSKDKEKNTVQIFEDDNKDKWECIWADGYHVINMFKV